MCERTTLIPRSPGHPWQTVEITAVQAADDGFNPLGTGPDLEIKPRDTATAPQALMHKTEES